jgi:hypothetical protein
MMKIKSKEALSVFVTGKAASIQVRLTSIFHHRIGFVMIFDNFANHSFISTIYERTQQAKSNKIQGS